MHGYDLAYYREMHGISQAKLGRLLGRSTGAIGRWESGLAAIPKWLPDWLEMMDFEMGRGNDVGPVPRHVEDIEAILYPGRRKKRLEEAASLAERRDKRQKILAKRDANRTLRLERQLNHEKMEQAKRRPDAYRPVLRKRETTENKLEISNRWLREQAAKKDDL